jgi:membrane-associated protease RseP (regulator of RpoE activity)
MSRITWIGGVAAVVLTAATARALAAGDGPRLEGPPRIDVQAEVIEAPAAENPALAPGENPKSPAGVEIQPDNPRQRRVQIRRVQLIGAPPQVVVQPGYWLGMACSEAGAALRAQLGLPEGQGLVVERVVADSPAAKAEIRQHDVLLKAGDKPLKEVQNLIDAVQQSDGKELSIELIRGGKTQVVAVTPAKQLAPAASEQGEESPAAQSRETLRKLLESLGAGDDAVKLLLKPLEQLESGEPLEAPLRFRFLGPGTIVQPEEKAAPLPEDMSITITRKGDKLAKITVRQGDEQWEVTEDELGKLPETVRGYVEQIMGRLMGSLSDRVLKFDELRLDVPPDVTVPETPEAEPEGRLEKRLDEMKQQIEQLRKTIDELRESRPRVRRAPEEGI